MARRFRGFDIKAAVVLIIVVVAIFTSVWLTKQIKPVSGRKTLEPKGATLPSEQLEALRAPLPQVTTQSKQEAPMAFTAKKDKDPFVPDWPIRPREDKRDAKVSIEIAKVAEDAGERDYEDLHEPPKDLHEPPKEPPEPPVTASLPLPDEDSAEGIDEEPTAVIGDIAPVNEEAAEFEDDLPETEGRLKEAVAETMEEVPAGEIPSSDVPVSERETAIELKPEVTPPKLFVTGIIVSEDASYAIVDTLTGSVIAQPGDEIEGATVTSVEEKTVVVVKEDKEFVLELGGGGES
jgi:hypothetical protein